MSSLSIFLTLDKLSDARKHLETYSKYNYCLTALSRSVETECTKFKVKILKAKNVETSLEVLKVFQSESKKAENVLLDTVETDLAEKALFVHKQVEILQGM
jgi:hypothetical protein